jgi:hypothetical protein
MIEVSVGDTTVEQSSVQERLITSRSHFFAIALTSTEGLKWPEDEERKMDLPEDEPQVFTHYMQLLYCGTLPFRKPIIIKPGGKNESPTQDVLSTVHAEYDRLLSLYLFVEKIQDLTSKRLVLGAFIEVSTTVRADGRTYYSALECIASVFDGTSESDPLREQLVDQCVRLGRSDWVQGVKEEHCTKAFSYQAYRETMIQRTVPERGTLVVKDKKYYLEKIHAS